MKDKKIESHIEIHIFSLLEFLHDEVLSAGGDGDALWYVRLYDIKEIERLVREYNDENDTRWDIEVNDSIDGTIINWGEGQEWVTITNSEEAYVNAPDWQQIKIRY